MRVLWLCNIMLPAFARMYGLESSNREGWLTGCFERLIHEQASSRENLITLGVCCPVPEHLGNCHQVLEGENEARVDFYGFQENLNTPEIYNRELEDRFFAIIRDFKPDIVHIFGTEFPHCLAMVRAFHHPEQTLIGIQGLCCSIADAYMADLPYKVQRRVTFRDWYRRDSLENQRHKYRMRANMEAQALRHTAHITGRTSFDRRVSGMINEDAVYHSMNETLRPEFYTGRWEIGKVEPYSIFLSQGDYPLKGFHFMLQAMPEILEKFPQAHLYVAGNSIIGNVGGVLKEKKKYPEPCWISSYGLYLKELIRTLHLKGHVTMLGRLDAAAMKEQYLRSHVFVCPSVMENSPNSLCEAMLLGMPTVSAKVGGIGDLVADGEEGILFPSGKTDELAEGVMTVFCDDSVAGWLGENARAQALIRHNPDTNYSRLLEIYHSICGL